MILVPCRVGLTALALAASVAALGAQDPLIEAADRGNANQVRGLIAAGADVNARDEGGRTALVHAAGSDSVKTVEALVEAGADLDASDRNGLTALIEATRLDREAIVRVLLEAGATPDMRHRAFGTALDVAERNGQQALAALLRSHGARGSGHSVGDTVCVRPWDGRGYCGRILAVERARYHLMIVRLVGCDDGCAPDGCSAGQPLGGPAGLAAGDRLWAEGACLTDTGLGDADTPAVSR